MAVKHRRGELRFLIETRDLGEPKTLRPAKERAKGEEGSHAIPRLFENETLKCAQTMWADERMPGNGTPLASDAAQSS
jgi:hypothetical protein